MLTTMLGWTLIDIILYEFNGPCWRCDRLPECVVDEIVGVGAPVVGVIAVAEIVGVGVFVVAEDVGEGAHVVAENAGVGVPVVVAEAVDVDAFVGVGGVDYGYGFLVLLGESGRATGITPLFSNHSPYQKLGLSVKVNK